MNEIPETIEKVINVLADKFGQTGQELWGAIVFQQKINGILNGLLALVISIFSVAAFPVWFQGAHDMFRACTATDGSCYMPIVFCWIGLVISITCIGACLWEGIIAFFNPTYRALMEVLRR